ncbi:hypothetical protein NX059_012229 [Plenodomus lindquistii]|nr:hypothetical protein NX059_012229 [Plenodomus lindquistii]
MATKAIDSTYLRMPQDYHRRGPGFKTLRRDIADENKSQLTKRDTFRGQEDLAQQAVRLRQGGGSNLMVIPDIIKRILPKVDTIRLPHLRQHSRRQLAPQHLRDQLHKAVENGEGGN